MTPTSVPAAAADGRAAGGSAGVPAKGWLRRFLFVHEIDEYPSTGKRTG